MALDIDGLLTPISDSAPCGDDLSYDPDYLALEEAVYNPGGTEQGEEPTDPEWPRIQKLSIDLFTRTKDLRIATYLALSDLSLNGLNGFRDGLILIARLVCENWDSVWPQLDPDDGNDPLERLNILTSLSPDAGVYQDPMMFIQRLRDVSLCKSARIGSFSLRDIMISTGELDPSGDAERPDQNLINAAFMDSPIELLQNNIAAVDEGLDALNQIVEFLNNKLGAGNGIGFDRLIQELNSIKRHLNDHLSRRGAGEAPPGEEDPASSDEDSQNHVESGTETMNESSNSPGQIPNEINSRADVLRALDKLCAYFEKNEPASPVPLMLRRAQRLVTMSFYDILEEITPDAVNQAQVVLGSRPVADNNSTEDE